jgi:hypothetical protein
MSFDLALDLLTRLSTYPVRLLDLQAEMQLTRTDIIHLAQQLCQRGISIRVGLGINAPTFKGKERGQRVRKYINKLRNKIATCWCVWVEPDDWHLAEKTAERYYNERERYDRLSSP